MLNAEARLLHIVDDYEILRGRVRRHLKADISLLTDGLHALRCNKAFSVRVMDDHADRVLQNMIKLLKET